MSTICCKRCAFTRRLAIRRHLDHGTTLWPCECECHQPVRDSLPRGIVIGALIVALPWMFISALIWRLLS